MYFNHLGRDGTGLILCAKDQTALVPPRMVVGRGSLSSVVNLTAPDRRDTDIYICSTRLTVRCFAGRAGISVKTNISISAIILWSANEMLWLGICTSTTSAKVAPSTFGAWFVEGAIPGGALSTLKALFVESSMSQGWTFHAGGRNRGGSSTRNGTFRTEAAYRGRFNAAGVDLPR